MKKVILTAVIILLAGITLGQSLKKGNLLCMHYMTFNLNPDVTMNQCKDFFINKYIPESEKQFPGVKTYLLEDFRGKNEHEYIFVAIFESEKERDKYYNADGSPTELKNASDERLKPIMEEFSKLGTMSAKYAGWVVQ
jgi:hypothetical protein